MLQSPYPEAAIQTERRALQTKKLNLEVYVDVTVVAAADTTDGKLFL
jgi:hypothetical protein